MLDIDSYLRISLLLTLVLKRGRGAEGKITHDLTQTHTISQHRCVPMLDLRFPRGPKWTHVESVLRQGIHCRSLAAVTSLSSFPSLTNNPLSYQLTNTVSWRVHNEIFLMINEYIHCQTFALAPCSVLFGKLPPLSPPTLWKRLWVDPKDPLFTSLAPACFFKALCSSVSTGL